MDRCMTFLEKVKGDSDKKAEKHIDKKLRINCRQSLGDFEMYKRCRTKKKELFEKIEKKIWKNSMKIF